MKDEAKNYKFDDLAQTVRTLANLDGMERDMTVPTSYLLSTYLAEKRKYDRYKEANRPKD